MNIGSSSADVRLLDPAVTSTLHWRRIAENTSAGYISAQLLHEKANRQAFRVPICADSTVIVKFWKRPGIRGTLSRAMRINPSYREWRALNLMHEHRVPSPRPLAYFRLRDARSRHDEALVLEDLGECQNAITYVKVLLTEERLDALARFEARLVSITQHMIRLRLVDTDHRVRNFTITPVGQVVRLDLEHAARVASLKLFSHRYGIMLGTLVGSYVFAVQPHIERAICLAGLLAETLAPSRQVLTHARSEVKRLLEVQRCRTGIDSRIRLPW